MTRANNTSNPLLVAAMAQKLGDKAPFHFLADEQREEQDAQENLQKLFHIMSVFCVCCEFRGLFFADRVYGFDPQCPGRRDDACQQAAQDEDPQREHSHTEGDLP